MHPSNLVTPVQGMTNVATLVSLADLVFCMHQEERDYQAAEELAEKGLRQAVQIVDDWGPTFELRLELSVLRCQKGLFAESEATVPVLTLQQPRWHNQAF